MKKLLENNIKLIVAICSITITIIVVVSFSNSLATGENTNKIYTRDELSNIVEDLTTRMVAVENDTSSSNMFLNNYPIGSIYISESSTNPGITYGGTWIAYGAGRTLVGVGTGTDANIM